MSIAKGILQVSRSPTRSKAVTASGLIAAGYESSLDTDAETYARKLSAVDRCMEILAGSMSKLPNYVFDTRTRQRTDHSILYVLNTRPNEAMTPSVRKSVLENSRNEGGNGYDWILRDPHTGRVRELIPIPYWLVEPWKDTAGRIWYTVTHPLTGEPMVLPNEDICHYKGATRDGLKGISVLRRASGVISTARAAQQYEQAFYESGGQPSGILTVDTDLGGYVKGPDGKPMQRTDGSYVTLKDSVRSEWERLHTGPKNGHRTAILDLGLKYTPIAASNAESQFVESKEISIKDICRFFGVPIHFLGEGKMSYNSNEQESIGYVVRTLHPIVTQYEEELTWKLLTDKETRKGLEIRFNLMAELRGDNASRAAWYQSMHQTGVFSVNDIRALEDLPDVPGGDCHMASLNYVPIEDFRELSISRNHGKFDKDFQPKSF